MESRPGGIPLGCSTKVRAGFSNHTLHVRVDRSSQALAFCSRAMSSAKEKRAQFHFGITNPVKIRLTFARFRHSTEVGRQNGILEQHSRSCLQFDILPLP